MDTDTEGEAARLDIPLNRDRFLRSLLSELAGTLEDVVGTEDAAGFISLVGATIGNEINEQYRLSLGGGKLTRAQIADVLVDLKKRIGGDFYVIDEDENRIVLGNRACPFGEKVIGRPSLCMMTSNVFGRIAADNAGYARVTLEETIARGHGGCRVVIWLRPASDSEGDGGREYFSVE